jgi:hypothetical protein
MSLKIKKYIKNVKNSTKKIYYNKVKKHFCSLESIALWKTFQKEDANALKSEP